MKTYNYHQLTEMTVLLESQQNYNLTVMHGKVLVNEEESFLSFEQSKPRGPRSAEVMRTKHARLVKRPDGAFTLTFRFTREEYGVGQQMIDELRKVVDFLSLNLTNTFAA